MQELDPQHFMKGEYLYNDVKAYAGLGEHRTATAEDLKTSQWLSKQLEGFGFASKLYPFTVRQFFLDAAKLTVDGKEIPCFPLWPPSAAEVTAPLTGTVARGRIAVAVLPFANAITATSGHLEILNPLIAAGATGIIGVTPSPSGEVLVPNSDRGDAPWKIPILLIGSAHEAAVRNGREARMVIRGRDELRAEAQEVVGTIGRGSKRVVVSTPSSGWFRCAGERGPGIALWLALARWASHRESNSRYLFVASSAHELAEQGMQRFLAEQAPPSGEVDIWLHLGAGIAAHGSTRRLMTNRRDWMPVLSSAFHAVPDLKPEIPEAPLGEMRQLMQRGYPAFAIAGLHRLHHSPQDTADRATGPELLEPVGQALLRALADLEERYGALARRQRAWGTSAR